MEIIDLKRYSKNKLLPISKYGDLLLISENKEFKEYPFTESGILNYYFYNIKSEKISKIDRDKYPILVDAFHEKKIEGEDAHYYITMKKQLFENQYFLNKISIEDEKIDTIFEFKMDNKYPNLEFEVLDNDHILVFYKPEEVYDFENFDYGKDHYGYDRGILYNINNGEEYEIKDKEFLRGFRLVFFKTTIMNEMCVVYEENYLESFEKEQIYMDDHMNKIPKKEKFFYKDCLKYSTLETFLSEVKMGKEKISFIDIESRGIKGFEIFSGTDENNIYYLVGDFGEEELNVLVMINKQDLSKKTIKLPEEYDEEDGIKNVRYICCLEDKYKSIFQLKNLTNNKIEMKEVINGNINYTYSNDLGTIQSYIEEKFLIACVNNKKTSVIDVENNSIKCFNRESKVFDEYLILY
ncbi:hypothetical protein K9O30_01075 [Clostridium bowmanii]|uniref:hypothetical protein n=1 Tax=Clostridium bowmanii TaxID=132925 RepID=UPI001C0C0E00|nr:hypothetical protein [Clostridium bowmanii]MBU3188174.1 hypothetical protein [Clostridium bowmanii]MCA1072356.1 hypothetical protein [Clostridium bowmanii]